MKKSTRGFTLVELIIVIVIISILAVLTIVAYRGIIQKSRTSQTMNAGNQWVKILQSYRARNGAYPVGSGCLGSNYTWGSAGSKAQGSETAQCNQGSALGPLKENTTLNDALKPYSSVKPSPAFVTASSSTSVWQRGISYYVESGQSKLAVVYDGKFTSLTECPQLGGLSADTFNIGSMNNNTTCVYKLGTQTGY